MRNRSLASAIALPCTLALAACGTTAGDGLHANEIRHQHEADVLYRGVRQGLEAAGRA